MELEPQGATPHTHQARESVDRSRIRRDRPRRIPSICLRLSRSNWGFAFAVNPASGFMTLPLMSSSIHASTSKYGAAVAFSGRPGCRDTQASVVPPVSKHVATHNALGRPGPGRSLRQALWGGSSADGYPERRGIDNRFGTKSKGGAAILSFSSARLPRPGGGSLRRRRHGRPHANGRCGDSGSRFGWIPQRHLQHHPVRLSQDHPIGADLLDEAALDHVTDGVADQPVRLGILEIGTRPTCRAEHDTVQERFPAALPEWRLTALPEPGAHLRRRRRRSRLAPRWAEEVSFGYHPEVGERPRCRSPRRGPHTGRPDGRCLQPVAVRRTGSDWCPGVSVTGLFRPELIQMNSKEPGGNDQKRVEDEEQAEAPGHRARWPLSTTRGCLPSNGLIVAREPG